MLNPARGFQMSVHETGAPGTAMRWARPSSRALCISARSETREKRLLVLLHGAHDGLVDLHDRDDQEAERERGDHALGLEVLHAEEDHRERVDLDHDERENERKERGAPQPLVLLLHVEDGGTAAAHVEAVEDLDHVEGDERHHDALLVRHGGGELREVNLAQVEVHTAEEADEHEDSDDDTLDHGVEAHVAGEHAVGGVTRLALHDVALGLLHAQRERGEAVGDEVHPQQLDGLEQREAHERGREDREHLGEVRGEQELDDLADVVVDATALFARVDDRGEVVVGEHHVGDVLGDVGAGDAHAHA